MAAWGRHFSEWPNSAVDFTEGLGTLIGMPLNRNSTNHDCIAANLRRLMAHQGLTVHQAAERTGLDQRLGYRTQDDVAVKGARALRSGGTALREGAGR